MLQIKSPKEYVNEPGAIKNIAKYLDKFGKNALVIGSDKSLEAVKDDLFPNLKNAGIY